LVYQEAEDQLTLVPNIFDHPHDSVFNDVQRIRVVVGGDDAFVVPALDYFRFEFGPELLHHEYLFRELVQNGFCAVRVGDRLVE